MDEFYDIRQYIPNERYDERSIDELVNSGERDFFSCADELREWYEEDPYTTVLKQDNTP